MGKSFQNVNVNDMVHLFNRTIKNILRNLIPNETITCDDRDPPWINSSIRSLIQDKNETYKRFKRSNNSSQYFENFQSLQNVLGVSIEASKERYYSRLSMKLMEPSTSPKTYWSVLKSFYNNKKIPCILPIFHENRFVTNFKEKAELFHSFFAKQCSIIDNGSEIPSFLHPKTNQSLSNITFAEKDIEKVIQSLDPNKAHGHDMISIRMLKICGKSIIKPPLVIYKKCLEKGCLPNEWKKANIVPAHKKNDNQLLKNYRPISLLPIWIFYNSLFEFFIQNNLITPNQSGFKTGDSCINQLISNTHEIYKSFADGYEVRGVFLDISKAFDKVRHQGLHYKLKQNGISGELLNILTDFLDNRTQRVLLNGQYSSWAKVEAGVSQGSILGPLLFLIYINDLSENLASNPKLFADDTSLFSVVKSVNASNIDLNNDLKKIGEWVFQWKMSFNREKLYQELGLETLQPRRWYRKLC